MRTAAAALGRKGLRRCDRDHLVDPLLDALEADEVVQRFFIDYTIRGGDSLWVALTAHRLLILKYKGGILHPRHLMRPLQAWANPRGGGLCWRVEVEGAEGQRMRFVLLDQVELEDLCDVETSAKFPRSLRAEPAPHQAPADRTGDGARRAPAGRSRSGCGRPAGGPPLVGLRPAAPARASTGSRSGSGKGGESGCRSICSPSRTTGRRGAMGTGVPPPSWTPSPRPTRR